MLCTRDLANVYKNGEAYKPTDDELESLHKFIIGEYYKTAKIVNSQGKKILYTDEKIDTFEHLNEQYFLNDTLLISTYQNNCPYLPGLSNLMFRAIHDFHHVTLKADFSFNGELETFRHIQSKTSNRRLMEILFSEIVLQASFAIEYGNFAEQKIVIYPYSHRYI